VGRLVHKSAWPQRLYKWLWNSLIKSKLGFSFGVAPVPGNLEIQNLDQKAPLFLYVVQADVLLAIILSPVQVATLLADKAAQCGKQ